MDKKYIADNNIGSKYLRGLLSADEIVQFECYLLDKPELAEQLELDAVFFEVMPQLEKSQTKFQPKAWGFLDIPLRRALVPIFVPVIVCLFVIPLAVVSLFREPVVSSIQPVFLTSDDYRTIDNQLNDISVLKFQDDGQVILLLLYPGNELAEDFNVSLKGISGTLVQRIEGRARGDSGYISIELSSSALDEGDYFVEIIPTNTPAEDLIEAVESIPFRIIKNVQ